MTVTGKQVAIEVIRVTVNPNVCHNGACTLPKRQDVLGPYCSWRCRNEEKCYDDD